MQNQNVWKRLLTSLFGLGNAEASSSSATLAPQGSEAAFPYEFDSIGIPQGHVIMDVQGVDGQFTSIDFEVDTGAYCVTMPASAAAMFGLTLTQGKPGSLAGVDGKAFPVYTFQMTVRIAGLGVFQIPIAFSTLETPILAGWYGFLQQFHSIQFNNESQQTVFT